VELPEKQGLKLEMGRGNGKNGFSVAVELPEKQGLKPLIGHKPIRIIMLQWNFQKNKD